MDRRDYTVFCIVCAYVCVCLNVPMCVSLNKVSERIYNK